MIRKRIRNFEISYLTILIKHGYFIIKIIVNLVDKICRFIILNFGYFFNQFIIDFISNPKNMKFYI